MFSWTSRLNQKPLFLEFSGFYILFSFQGSLLLSQRQLIYIIISSWLCQQLFYFIFNLSQKLFGVSALISSIDLPLSQGRMLWYQSFPGLSTIFLYLLFFLFCYDFLEFSDYLSLRHLFLFNSWKWRRIKGIRRHFYHFYHFYHFTDTAVNLTWLKSRASQPP